MTIRKVDAYGASLGANTFTGAQVAPSLALGGASGATLAVTGTANISGVIVSGGGFSSNGNNITVNGVRFNNGTNNRGYLIATVSDGQVQFLADGGTNFGVTLDYATADTLKLLNKAGSSGAVVQAASLTLSGALTVPGVTTAALTSTGTFTSGAGAQVGTLTNAPAAGNPTTWIKIIDNGTTRYIPAW